MTNSPGDASPEPSASAGAAGNAPPGVARLCDRQKPICARCAKAGGECIYPESRRKPAFKRRNVKELEERLAQVEGLLKHVGKRPSHQAWSEGSSPSAFGGEPSRPDRPQGSPQEGGMPGNPLSPTDNSANGDNAQFSQLLGLGQFESLPPFDMIEELYVRSPCNYFRSFHSPPHMRPPLSLQYAIWTLAANGHSKYGSYHDALYRRARQYLEAEELKGHGEHFITIGHAQAWGLVATDEARCLLFTRAAMSSARCIRLSSMMGLNRLDDPLDEEERPMAPMIVPSKSWAELEERRRLFWGGYCLDIVFPEVFTALADRHQVTTRLPASEEAFASGEEEESCTLPDAFEGFNYSTFAGNVIVCRIFTKLIKHAHRPMPGDRPEDPDFGPFWKRHRELDNMLSSAFMFMPERFRLPRNLRDSTAVQANLNFHAAIISLHNTAREKADKFKLPGIMQSSRARALTAAHEIVDIMKATGTLKAGYRGPLMAISLYLAASVFITQAKEDPDQFDKSNLELLITCMAAVGLKHVVSHAYLKQVLDDLERNGILAASDPVQSFRFVKHMCGHSIPLVARGAISRHTKMQTPLPGRLPLGEPQGVPSTFSEVPPVTCSGFVCPDPHSATDESNGPASKRIRISTGPSPAVPNPAGCPSTLLPSLWFAKGNEQTATTNARAPAASMFEDAGASSWTYTPRFTMPNLPDRTGSPAMNNQAAGPPPTTRPPPPPSPNPRRLLSLYGMLVDMSSDEFNGAVDPWQLANAATAASNNSASSSSSARPWGGGGGGGGGGVEPARYR
ncbi:hypothetical protein N0V88_001637 [Collariella sp. IMI 366227]|nr:hypothetical protein N0V88_001637 [Collariella sp. IMI 366227]